MLAQYRQRFGDLNSQPQQNFQATQRDFQQQTFQQPAENQVQQPPQKFFSVEDAKQIDDAIKKTAMQPKGFSEEDVDTIDYLEDDDPKIGLWNHAKELAKIAIYNQIFSAQMAEYEALRNFASTEFFDSQSSIAQQIIREAD